MPQIKMISNKFWEPLKSVSLLNLTACQRNSCFEKRRTKFSYCHDTVIQVLTEHLSELKYKIKILSDFIQGVAFSKSVCWDRFV